MFSWGTLGISRIVFRWGGKKKRWRVKVKTLLCIVWIWWIYCERWDEGQTTHWSCRSHRKPDLCTNPLHFQFMSVRHMLLNFIIKVTFFFFLNWALMMNLKSKVLFGGWFPVFGYDPNWFSNFHKVTGELDYIYIHEAYVQTRFLQKAQAAVWKEQKGWLDLWTWEQVCGWLLQSGGRKSWNQSDWWAGTGIDLLSIWLMPTLCPEMQTDRLTLEHL